MIVKKRIISLFLIFSIIISVCSVGIFTTSAATAVPASPKIGSVNNFNGFVNINWSRASGAAQYCMWYQVGNNTKWNWVCTTKTYWNIQHPLPGTKFTIKISAMNKNRVHSDYSATKTITYVLYTPSYGISYTKDKKKFDVHWSKIEGATEYEAVYFYKGEKIEAYRGKETSFVHKDKSGNSSIAAGGPYYYQVRAVCKASNNKSYSNWSKAVPNVYFAPKIDISTSSIIYDFGKSTSVRARYDHIIYWSGEKGIDYKISFYVNKSDTSPKKEVIVRATQKNNNDYELWSSVKYAKIAIEYDSIPNYSNVSRSTMNLRVY